MSSVDELLKEMDKQYGDAVVGNGHDQPEYTRADTGMFPIDLAIGGGFPVGKMSIIYGPESSLKTTVALKAIAQYQRTNPDKTCVFVDIEASYDKDWAIKLGVQTEKLKLLRPTYAEMAVDLIEGILYADDCGVVVVDSLAAMVTANELNSSAEKAVVGGSGLVIGRFYRKAVMAISTAIRKERYPTLICINQIRFKIGVMYGDPETMPGGNAFRYGAALILRLYGKDEIDKKINATLPSWKICSGIVKKYKIPIFSKSFEFRMSINKNTGFAIGDVDDWNTFKKYMQDFGIIRKGEKAGSWFLGEQEFKTISSIRKHIDEDESLNLALRELVFETALGDDEEDNEDAETEE